jgi:N-sulfoglucosamine sulfohydrolase
MAKTLNSEMTKQLSMTLIAAISMAALRAVEAPAKAHTPERMLPNLVVFVVDDMDFASMNANGCPVPGLTPNMDRLASEGVLFENAHVPNAVCQPSRQSMITGLHPHRNGSLGFEPVPPGVPNLSELLMAHGYYTASFNKGRDYASFKWSEFLDGYGTSGFGYDPKMFVASAKKSMLKAKSEGKPFFLNIATSDPHRPFPESADEEKVLQEMKKKWPQAAAAGEVYFPPYERICTPDQAWVPPYLPDLPEVREELSQYYNAVHRADETLGGILDLLKAIGVAENTIVVFFSDNGASFAPSKQNCYPYSTRATLIVRWPAMVKPGSRDSIHMVSTMDIMPTILEQAGIPLPDKLDGRSLLPMLQGKPQTDRDHVYTTQNYYKPGFQVFPMRAVHTREFTYIFNAWSDGKQRFQGECMSGLTFAAMEKAAKTDAKVAERVKHIAYREAEELYDLKSDPWCLQNLVADPGHAVIKAEMKRIMEAEMRQTDDPLQPRFLGKGELPAAWLVAKPGADSSE